MWLPGVHEIRQSYSWSLELEEEEENFFFTARRGNDRGEQTMVIMVMRTEGWGNQTSLMVDH